MTTTQSNLPDHQQVSDSPVEQPSQPNPRPRPKPSNIRQNNVVLVGLIAVFVVPFLLALYLYSHPHSSLLSPGHHGQLIEPPQSMNNFLGQVDFERKWRVLVMTSEPCTQACENLLHATHRLVRSLGEDQERFQRWLVSPNSIDWNPQDIAFTQFDLDKEGITAFIQRLPRENGRVEVKDLQLAIYLVDPKARVLMVYPQDANFKKLRKDIRRLLRASRIG